MVTPAHIANFINSNEFHYLRTAGSVVRCMNQGISQVALLEGSITLGQPNALYASSITISEVC